MSRKLDVPVSKDLAKSEEQEKLSQLFVSQINLHIQGYQAKGLAYEKLKSYADAIREYKQAKTVVEKNFGTDNRMFKELVN